jgi:hypothetical protein
MDIGYPPYSTQHIVTTPARLRTNAQMRTLSQLIETRFRVNDPDGSVSISIDASLRSLKPLREMIFLVGENRQRSDALVLRL